MVEDQRQKLDKLGESLGIQPGYVVWAPNPGPQEWLVTCPVFETFFGGARGGGKTDAVLGEWIIHAQEWGMKAIGLCVRRKRTELVEMVERSKVLYAPLGATYKQQESMWVFPNGARLRFAYLENDSDADSYQGHNYSRVYVEEIGTFASDVGIRKLMATLGRTGAPARFIATGNPGGPGHNWVKARYVDPDPTGLRIIRSHFTDPFTGQLVEKDRIFIPSKVTDNPYTNNPAYIGNLYLSGSEQLVKSWLLGDWDTIAGAFFPEFNPNRHVIRTFTPPKHWTRFMSFDWGFATPFSVGWWCVVPDEFDVHRDISPADWIRTEEQARHPRLPPGAIIRYREWYGSAWREAINKGVAVADSANPNTGLRLTAKEVAAGIALREKDEPKNRDGKPRITWRVADPKIFSHDNGPSVAEQFGEWPHSIIFGPADNKRAGSFGALGGWDVLRHRLRGNVDGAPMIYFMDNCPDIARTLPTLQHDEKKAEDLDTTGEDHAPDETRYACMSRPYQISQQTEVRSYIKMRDNSVALHDDLIELEYGAPKYSDNRISTHGLR